MVTLAGLLGWQGVMLLILGNGEALVPINDNIINDFANGILTPAASWIVMIVLVAVFGADDMAAGCAPTHERTRRAAGEPDGAQDRRRRRRRRRRGPDLQHQPRRLVPIRGVPWVVLIVLGVLAMWTFVLGRTRFGRYLYAIGGNAEAARRAGINLRRSGRRRSCSASFTAGIAGIVYASRLRSISTNIDGGTLVLYAVAAAVIGGTSLFGGRGGDDAVSAASSSPRSTTAWGCRATAPRPASSSPRSCSSSRSPSTPSPAAAVSVSASDGPTVDPTSGVRSTASSFASIPSPAGNSLHVGPFELRAYGLMIALGVVVAVWITQRRWRARGGNPDDITAIAVWAVPAGLVGARLYHVITDISRFEGRWWHIVAVWEGGLGIPGGIAAGVLAGVVVARRRGLPVPDAARHGGPRAACRPGDRTAGQLVQPGALRQTHRPAVGRAHRPGPPARRPRGPGDLPPDVPLRGDLEPRLGRGAGRGSSDAGIPDPASSSPATWPATPLAGCGWSRCGSTPPPSCSASGSTSGSAPSSSWPRSPCWSSVTAAAAHAPSVARCMAGSHDRAGVAAAQHPTDRRSPDSDG